MRAWWLVWCLSIPACGGGSDSPSDGPTVDMAPPCTFKPDLRLLSLRAAKYGSMGGGNFGGMICVDGRTDLGCATVTGTNQGFNLCVPSSGDFELRMTQTGYEKVIYPFGQGEMHPQAAIEAGDDAFVNATYWSPISATYPPTTQGLLNIFLFDRDDLNLTPLAGATIAITPSTSLTVTYMNDQGMPSMTGATMTGTTGQAIVGNVPPGMYDLKITSATAPTCRAYHGGGHVSPLADHQLRIPVQAGSTTAVFVECK
jgi:hypothetical protein